VLELVERYISLKTKVRPTTRAGYKTVVNVLKADPFGQKKIADIKTSDRVAGWWAQLFIHTQYSWRDKTCLCNGGGG